MSVEQLIEDGHESKFKKLKFETEAQMFALEQYLDLLVSNLPILIDAERKKRMELAKLFLAEKYPSYVETAGSQIEFILPRYIFGSYIVFLWSFFEETYSRYCEWVEKSDEALSIYLELSLSDLGGNFLSRIDKYLTLTTLNFPWKGRN